MAEEKSSQAGLIAKVVVAVAAIGVGLFLVFGSTTPAVADGVFVGSIAIALAVYVWSGLTNNQARIVGVVLILLAAYAFIRGFGLLELSVLRQLGGIGAIVIGVILAIPFVRGLIAKK